MWQPNRAQWSIIWTVAVLVILAWPPGDGRSLLVKLVNRAADPMGSLPAMPAPLPMGLDDDGDAVAAHDAEESAYPNLLDPAVNRAVSGCSLAVFPTYRRPNTVGSRSNAQFQ